MRMHVLLAATALASLAAKAHATTTIFSQNFDAAPTGAALSTLGIPQLGGTAFVTVPGPAVAPNQPYTHSGTKAALLTPDADDDSINFTYREEVIDDFSIENIVSTSVSLNVTNPATGVVDRGLHTALRVYDEDIVLLATMDIFYDIDGTYGGQSNHLYLQGGLYHDLDDFDGNFFVIDYGAIPSASIGQAGYFNLRIDLDYKNGVAHFFESGEELGTDSGPFLFDPTSYTGYGEADVAFEKSAVGGNAPRLFMDDFSIVTTVPEPASIAMLGLGGLLLRRRR